MMHTSTCYEIRVLSHVDRQWAEWLANAQISYTDEGHMILTIHVTDQAHLYGIFSRLRDMRLTIVSLRILRSEA